MTTLVRSGPLVAAGVALLLARAPAWGQGCGEGGCGGAPVTLRSGGGATGHCPPCLKHYYEGPPRIKFKCSCPKPICDPCHLEHYGYYQTCWAPWPFPPDWSHCPVPPPSVALPPPAVPPFSARTRLPTPDRPTPTDDSGPGLSPMPPGRPRKPDTDLPPPKRLDEKPSVRLIQ
jgi:hypothetical protein